MNKLNRSKKLFIGFAFFLFLGTVSLPACAANGKECLTISKEKIENTLKKMNAQAVEIVGIKKSPLDGICEIEVNNRGSAGIFYTDIELNYVIFGNLYDARNVVNLTAVSIQKLQDQKKIDLAQIAVNEKLAIGEKGATKKVIVFSDPD
jgi:protein-disulfide isomerase